MKLCTKLWSMLVFFQRSTVDLAVFYTRVGEDVAILFIHVDNTTITGSSLCLIEESE